ncbi:MAG: amidophosphoribosyltransferase [Candidatus Omnitrophota bacterium]|nr:MAG: amidophosphoribosyltransferase [Candidatus Omnitrophota bacterium]
MSGIFGVVSKNDCVEDLFYIGDYHSHLGSQFGGVAIYGDRMERRIHNISYSQFKSKLYEDYQALKGTKGIGIIGYEEQPIYVKSKFGDFCLVVNGWIDNWKNLADELFAKGYSFSEVSDSRVNICELVSKLIVQKGSFIEGIEYMFSRIEGSVSLLILNKEGILAVRDKLGISTLTVGEKAGSWAIVSETTSFPNLEYKTVKCLLPGEVVFIGKEGMQQKQPGARNLKICAFLWIYTGFPASTYEGMNVEVVREKCGCLLAKDDRIHPDLAAGVPDSGTAHALGYAMCKKIPYRRPLVKYTPGYGRSYLPPSQQARDLVAKMKLIPIKEIIQGQKIVLCEDSIVRGTQLKNFTVQKLWNNQAKEVHVRTACPPLAFPCKYNFSTRSKEELAAHKAIKALEGKEMQDISEYIDDKSPKYEKMVSWIAHNLGVTSLKYQKLQDMVKAIGLPKDNLCLYCWTGKL